LLSLLSIGCEVFDLILIDGPPVLGLADAQLLSSAASATVFVVAAGSAKTGAIRGALKRLQLSRANLIGAVLTKYEAKRVSYGYGYGEGNEYRYAYAGSTAKAEASAVDPQIPQLADLQKRLVKIADNL
jgi:succinoglycan biosynthesis transport protein ExoP